jgi:hypothetical protein
MVSTRLQLNGRTVIDAVVDGIDMSDYPDFCDAYFESACYEDGATLTDDELVDLTDHNQEILHEMVYDQIY